MIEKQQNKIINLIYDNDDVKRLIYLKKQLNNNKEYNNLLKESEKKDANLLEIRKKLFQIKEFKEYNTLYVKIKLVFIQINKIITSIIDNNTCKNNQI